MVPRPAAQDGKARNLHMTLGCRTHQRQIPVLAQDHEVRGRQDDLSVAVTSALPLQGAGCRVEAGENGFIQSVDEAVVVVCVGQGNCQRTRAPSSDRLASVAPVKVRI